VPYHYYHLFDSRDSEYDYGVTIHVWDGGEKNAGRVLTAGWADKDKASLLTWPCPWKAGEWHRLALNWERTGEGVGDLVLYVDGKQVAAQTGAPHFPSRPYRRKPPDLFILGTNSTNSPNTSATAVLDWLRI